LIPKNKEKKTNNKKITKNNNKTLIAFNIIEIVLILVICILFYLTKPVTTTQVLFIPKGTTTEIITYLNKSGFELNTIDNIVLRTLGYIQSGWINLEANNLSKMDFLYKLTTSKAALKNITLIPGETYYFFFKDIAQKFNLNVETLLKTYNKYSYKQDGTILADTYSLPYGMKEDHIVLYLLSQTDSKYEEFSKKIFGYYDKEKWYSYITLASVIQKEAANKYEMPIVSSVIHNRIKKGMKLQMDGTLNYGKFSHTKITSKMIKENITKYNTYKYKGLPSNPVSSVTLNAIKAAIFPVKSQYLYFVRDNKTGLHKFSASYKEHLNNIRANRYVKKSYTKVKEKTTPIDNKAKKIMETDITKQKQNAIVDLWKKVN
jgi:UPF0755 protein